MVKQNSCIFISGNGTNLKALIKNSKDYKFPINICLIITNNKNARGLNLAKLYNIPFNIFDLGKLRDQQKALTELKKRKITLICLAGYMKILSKDFIKKFNGKIINIHPSLLPKYKGLNTHEKAIKNKDKFSGCTVHFVNKKLDSGKIIMQKKVKILKNESSISLAEKVLKEEHKLFPAAIMKIFN